MPGRNGAADDLSDAEKVRHMPTEPNVVNIAVFYNPYSPWIWNENKSKIRGIYVGGLYLLGPGGKGVFGDGVICPKLYVLQKDPGGKKTPVLAKEWSFTVEKAIPWRAKQKRDLGWGYGLPLDWGDLDLSGQEISMIITFERSDGLIVSSGKKHYNVPGGAY